MEANTLDPSNLIAILNIHRITELTCDNIAFIDALHVDNIQNCIKLYHRPSSESHN